MPAPEQRDSATDAVDVVDRGGELVVVDGGEAPWPALEGLRAPDKLSFRDFFGLLGFVCFVASVVLVWIDLALAGGVLAVGVLLWVLRVRRPFNEAEFVEFAERYGVAERWGETGAAALPRE
jgi:hypothetical protein